MQGARDWPCAAAGAAGSWRLQLVCGNMRWSRLERGWCTRPEGNVLTVPSSLVDVELCACGRVEVTAFGFFHVGICGQLTTSSWTSMYCAVAGVAQGSGWLQGCTVYAPVLSASLCGKRSGAMWGDAAVHKLLACLPVRCRSQRYPRKVSPLVVSLSPCHGPQ